MIDLSQVHFLSNAAFPILCMPKAGLPVAGTPILMASISSPPYSQVSAALPFQDYLSPPHCHKSSDFFLYHVDQALAYSPTSLTTQISQ